MLDISLLKACDLSIGERLACVGAGGKTTTCWRLWEELRSLNHAVLFSTSTNIWEPVLPPRSALMLAPDPDATHIQHLLDQKHSVILARSRRSEPPHSVLVPNPLVPERPYKLKGLSLEQFDRLFDAVPDVTWLIEADGARGHGLKIPAEHEPQIPARASTVIVVIHLDTIGQALDENSVHRAEQVAEYLHVPLGAPIRAEHITRILSDPHAALKNVPASARVIAMLNQRNATQLHPYAREVVEQVLATQRYTRIIAASLRAAQPILEVWTH